LSIKYRRWSAHAADDRWGWRAHDRDRIRRNVVEDGEDEEFWEDGLDEDYDLEDEGIGPYDDEQPPRAIPFRKTEERVGRNEPCPCGSGKKFKKCCMKKQDGGLPFS